MSNKYLQNLGWLLVKPQSVSCFIFHLEAWSLTPLTDWMLLFCSKCNVTWTLMYLTTLAVEQFIKYCKWFCKRASWYIFLLTYQTLDQGCWQCYKLKLNRNKKVDDYYLIDRWSLGITLKKTSVGQKRWRQNKNLRDHHLNMFFQRGILWHTVRS